MGDSFASAPDPPAPLPETVTVTELAVVSNWKPAGAFRIMVPVDIPGSSDSLSTGPVRVVYAPVPPVAAVSAEIALPPVAVVERAESVKSQVVAPETAP